MQNTILILELCFWNLDLSYKSYAHWHDQRVDVLSQVQECHSNK
jgi:hypothetical protein